MEKRTDNGGSAVPGHDQTDCRRERARRIGRPLVAAILVAVALTARAGDNASALTPTEEIKLSADRVEYWDAPTAFAG